MNKNALLASRYQHLEESYLNHILIYLKDDDRSGSVLRTFVDNWFAYRHGGTLLNNKGNPHWLNNPNPTKHRDVLSRMHFRSANACDVLRGDKADELVKDHAIPISSLRVMMVNRKNELNSIDSIRTFLDRWYRIGVITKIEHERLSSSGLKSCMPKGWHESMSPFARYEHANIRSDLPNSS